MTAIFIIVLPVLLVVAVGLVGTTRRLGFWWTVLLSVVLTPIGGFLVALLSGSRRPQRPKRPRPPLPLAVSSAAAASTAAASTAASPVSSTVAAYIVDPPQP